MFRNHYAGFIDLTLHLKPATLFQPIPAATAPCRLGRRGGNRTPNLRIWSPVHYQLCYAPTRTSGRPPINRQSCVAYSYSSTSETTPEPTVRPPSRIAKRNSLSIAIGVINSTTISTLSPGITISVPSGNVAIPVTSVVRK